MCLVIRSSYSQIIGGGRYLRSGGGGGGGVWGHAPPKKLGALRSLLRSKFLYSNLYLDSMPLEYRARVFLERRSPCSGIVARASPSQEKGGSGQVVL